MLPSAISISRMRSSTGATSLISRFDGESLAGFGTGLETLLSRRSLLDFLLDLLS